MVSNAAKHSLPHKIGLFVSLFITLITDVLAITYVVLTRKKCQEDRLLKNDRRQSQSKTDLGWTLVGLAIADIILATLICGLTEYTRFL